MLHPTKSTKKREEIYTLAVSRSSGEADGDPPGEEATA